MPSIKEKGSRPVKPQFDPLRKLSFGAINRKANNARTAYPILPDPNGELAIITARIIERKLYGVCSLDPDRTDPPLLYGELRQFNAHWDCLFYEGLVAKRATDPYPIQLRSPAEEFVGWVKHRWAY